MLNLLQKIPKGKVVTYAELARALDTHPRAVAMKLKTNTDPLLYPCYKVVYSDGNVGGYAFGGTEAKRELLLQDGVNITNGKVDQRHFFTF